MPIIQIKTPDGQIKRLRVSEVPSEAQLRGIVKETASRMQVETPQVTEQVTQETQQPSFAPETGFESVTPEIAFEQARDIEEAAQRPGVGEFLSQVGTSGKKELQDLASAVTTFAKSPIQSSKAIKKAVSDMTFDDAKEIGKGMLVDMGRTFGLEPGRGFDVDVAIDRWREAPVSALGDAMVFMQSVNTASKAARGAKGLTQSKRAAKEALDAMAMDDLDKLKSTLTQVSGKEAFKEGFETGFEQATKIKPVTPAEMVANKAETIKRLSLKQLDSPNYFDDVAREISDDVILISKNENKALSSAFKGIADKKVDNAKLLQSIKSNLGVEGVADDAVTAIDDVIKTKLTEDMISGKGAKTLKTIAKKIDDGTQMTASEIKKAMDQIDQVVNWNTIDTKVSDRTLMAFRRSLRGELSRISKATEGNKYDDIATAIHNRLKKTEFAEKGLIQASKRGAKDPKVIEDFAKKIIASPERTKVYRNALKDLSLRESAITPRLAGDISAKLDVLETWKAWNELFGTTSKFTVRGDARGATIDRIITSGLKRAKKLKPEATLGTAAKAAKEGVKTTARRAKGTVKPVAIASTVLEDVNQ
jgi:hypothetical protein